MLYNPPSGSTDPNAKYVGKNVAAGTQGSKVPPSAVENTQREIVNAISAAGLTPTNNDLTQLAQAIAKAGTGGASQIVTTRLIRGGRYVEWRTPGTYQWTVPNDATNIGREVWGGGGSGGGSYGTGAAGSGGAGGGYDTDDVVATPGTILTIVVGAGGAAVATTSSGGGNGVTGGTTSITAASSGGSPLTATGGTGGGAGFGGIQPAFPPGGSGSTNRSRTGGNGGTGIQIPNGTPLSGVGGDAQGTSIAAANQGTSGTPGGFPAGGGAGASASGGAAGGKGGDGRARIYY